MSADVFGYMVAAILVYGKENVDEKEGISYIYLDALGEDNIYNKPYATQAGQIRNHVCVFQLLGDFIQGGNERYENQPDTEEKGCQYEGLPYGIEGWRVVILSPQLGGELLHRAVERGCQCCDGT